MTDLGRPRDVQGGLLFYGSYLVLLLFLRVLSWGFGTVLFDASFLNAFFVGNVLAALACLVLGVIILNVKGRLENLRYWIIVLWGGGLGLLGGEVLGLIPPAFLTTRPKDINKERADEGNWQKEAKVSLDDLKK